MSTSFGRQLAAYALTCVLVGWVVATITIQLVAAHQHGYGSGIGDGGRIPPAVIAIYQTTDRAEIVRRSMGDSENDPYEGK